MHSLSVDNNKDVLMEGNVAYSPHKAIKFLWLKR